MGDLGYEVAVDVGENGFFVFGAGDEEVGEGITDGVGDVFEGEVRFFFATDDDDVGVRGALIDRDGAAPVVWAVGGGEGEAVGDDLLEDVVFGEV